MVAADSDNIVMTTMSVDDEYAAHLRSSITALSDLVTAVHWTHSICAQVPVQLSDVHNTNASTSEMLGISYVVSYVASCVEFHHLGWFRCQPVFAGYYLSQSTWA